VKRIKVSFAGREVEFVDRERALAQIRDFGKRGTFPVYVVYGPEGCGKTAFLKQAKAVLEEEFSYHVIYTNPLAKRVEEIPNTRRLRRRWLRRSSARRQTPGARWWT